VGQLAGRRLRPIVISTLLREDGATGVQTHIREVKAYFTSRGNPPKVVTPMSWGGPLSIPAFAPRLIIDRLNHPLAVAWYRFWHFRFLHRALRKGLPAVGDAVIYAQCPLSARAALETRRDSSQRVVLAVHFSGSQADEWVDAGKIRRDGLVYRAIQKTERQVIPMVDGILYVSESSKLELEHNIPAACAVPAIVIPNFISSRQVEEDPPKHIDMMADLVNVGGLLKIKNHRFLLEVLAQANRLGRRYTLDVMGEGPMAHFLESRARSLGVRDQVRFLGHRDDVRTLLPSHRIYVHASSRENLCIAIIEAMAAGLPVVAAPTKGIVELFEPGIEGIWWSLTEPEAAAHMLIELLEDDARLTEMSKAARRRFDLAFDSTVVGPLMEDFLMSASSRGRETAAKLPFEELRP